MATLLTLSCPRCHGPMIAIVDAPVLTATGFSDCVRRCDVCGIGASNASRPAAITYIHRDPLENIPEEIREGAGAALTGALNVRSRRSKRQRFGFSTSEDAVTWVVFVHLIRSGQLVATLQRIGLLAAG